MLAGWIHASPASGQAVDRCGEPFGGVRPDDVTFLLAVPASDTVADRSSTEGTSFGQVVAIEEAGGAAADLLAAALGADRRAILVPWGFDDRCATIPWSGPWRWATPDSAEFFRGVLRARDAWIDGRPTFDIPSAVWEGFPHSPWAHPMSAGRRMLSAAELFEVYGMLPTADELSARPYGSVSALVDWRRDMGGLAERYPAGVLLRRAFLAAETARVRSSGMPFAGTYRIRVEDAKGDALGTFYMRTAAAGSNPLPDPGAPAAGVPTAPAPAVAYAAALALGPTPGALGRASGDDESGACLRPLGLRARVEETSEGNAPHAWPARVPPAFVAKCLASDPVLAGLSDPADDPDPDAPEAGGAKIRATAGADFGGVFRQESDGRFTFRQAAALPDGTAVTLVGERIEGTSLPLPPLAATLPD